MRPSDIQPAPSINAQNESDSKWQVERRAFFRLLPGLLTTHHGRFVAIHQQRVVAKGDDVVQVTLDAYKQHGFVSIYLGLVTEQPLASLRMPSPRVVAIQMTVP